MFFLRPIYLMAALVVGLFVGFALLPDFLFFPVAGIAMLIVGATLVSQYPLWGWALILVGVAMGVLGFKSSLDHKRREDEEAEKAEQEVSRRFGRIREDE